jgi:hypothetical protein
MDYEKFYREVKEAVETPTVDPCNGCSCWNVCGNNEQEIMARIHNILEKFSPNIT